MAEAKKGNINRYRSFIENIDVQELNNFEWEHLCVVLSSRVDIELYPFSLKSLKSGKHTFCHIPTGDQIVLTYDEQLEFVRWIEDEYMFGEPYSSYLAFQEAMNKDDNEYEEEEEEEEGETPIGYTIKITSKDKKEDVIRQLHERREWTSLRDKIVDELCKYFLKEKIHIFKNASQEDMSSAPDIYVISNEEKLLAIEVKKSINKKWLTSNWLIKNYFRDFEYSIITNGDDVSFIYQRSSNSQLDIQNATKTFSECLKLITKQENIHDVEDFEQGLIRIRQCIEQARKNSPFIQRNEIKQKIEKLKSFVEETQSSHTGVSVKNRRFVLNKEREQRLFDILLERDPLNSPDFIVKFSSIRSLQVILKEKTQNMCSLVCMNDPNEVQYAFDYIKKQWTGDSLDVKLSSSDDSNDVFILSGSQNGKENELTMWRLYGDDTKGICIKYKVDSKMVDQNGFYLAPVSYGQSADSHFELDFIRELLKNEFQIERWNLWRHFFKDYAYKTEDEIRLVYTRQEDAPYEIQWFTDDRTKIYAPMVLFKIGKNEKGEKMDPNFPLTIEKIYLGANQPAKTINEKQFEKRFREVNIYTENAGSVFECSGVTNYRSL